MGDRFRSVLTMTLVAILGWSMHNWTNALRGCDETLLEIKLNNFDSLFPFHFYRDVIVEGNPPAWQLPVAPFAFPDIPLAGFCLQLAGKEVFLAVILYGILQVAFLVVGLALLARQLGLTRRQSFAGAMLCGSMIFNLSAWNLLLPVAEPLTQWHHHQLTSRADPTYLFACQSHAATLGMVVWSWLVGVKWFRGTSVPWGWWVAFLGLIFLGMFGNMLFLVQFVLPYVGLLALNWWRGRIPGGTAITLAVSSLMTAHLGRWTIRQLIHIGITPAGDGRRWEVVGAFAHGLATDLILKPDPMVWASVLAVGVAGIAIWRRSSFNSNSLLDFFILSICTTFAAVVYGGIQEAFRTAPLEYYSWSKRYWQVFLYIPFLIMPFLLLRFRPRGEEILGGALAAVAVTLALGMPEAKRPILGYQPDLVKALDANPDLRDGDWGASEIWSSRLVTLYSRRNLRAIPLDKSMGSFLWLGNRRWTTVDLNEPPWLQETPWRKRVRFVVADSFNTTFTLLPGYICSEFGLPDRVETVRHWHVGIFSNPTIPSRPNANPAGEKLPVVGRESRIDILNHQLVALDDFWRMMSIRVRVHNRSGDRWQRSSILQANAVTLGWEYVDSRGQSLLSGRIGLPAAIEPGGSVELSAIIPIPIKGSFDVLRLGMKQDDAEPTLDIEGPDTATIPRGD